MIQTKILEEILNKVPLHSAAHGFVKGPEDAKRSICTNALPHVNQAIVINIDLKDFFPSITFPRVRGMFRRLGYSSKIATVLALLTTEAKVTELKLQEKLLAGDQSRESTWYLSSGERFLPQGAPSSPAITNIICKRLDARLSGLATKMGCVYTRYADDITFSTANTELNVGRVIHAIHTIVAAEDFVIHPKKTHVMRKHRRQEVTGVVVNQKTSVSRRRLRNFRALLHHIEKDGPAGKSWNIDAFRSQADAPAAEPKDILTVALGFASYVKMVDPEKGAPLLERVKELCRQYRPS